MGTCFSDLWPCMQMSMVRPAPGGRALSSSKRERAAGATALTWLLGMLHSRLNVNKGLLNPEDHVNAMHSLSFQSSQPDRRQQRSC